VTIKFLAVGGLTLDDIVTQAGQFHREVVGGSALYAALGARLWSDEVGLLSFAGQDFTPENLALIEAAGIDISLVARLEAPSIHLWVLYEADGRRQIFYEQRSSELGNLEAVVTAALPAVRTLLTAPAAVHVAALPVALQDPILSDLKPMAGQLTVDSIEARGTVGGDLQVYWDLSVFQGVDAFLPSREEFDVIRGELSVETAAWSLSGSDLRYVVVKDGARGAHLFELADHKSHRVPAYATQVLDPTGAGDAFCGGFMVGLAETGDALEATLRGTVSASFVIEALGTQPLLRATRAQAEQRLAGLRGMMSKKGM
jgi:cytidine kinase